MPLVDDRTQNIIDALAACAASCAVCSKDCASRGDAGLAALGLSLGGVCARTSHGHGIRFDALRMLLLCAAQPSVRFYSPSFRV